MAVRRDPTEHGFVAFPRGFEDEFFRQFTAERRAPFKRHGFTAYRWTKDAALHVAANGRTIAAPLQITSAEPH
jgi:hypothetical protein